MTQTVKKELLAQLQHLRTEVKEISRLYVANLQRDIVQLIEFLNENASQPVGKTKNSRTTSADLLRMKETLDAINVKPEKGRRKDLRRIEQAIRSLRKMAQTDKKDA
jgi:hypothetical protein